MGFRMPLTPDREERRRTAEAAFQDFAEAAVEALREVAYHKARAEELERELELAHLTIEQLRGR